MPKLVSAVVLIVTIPVLSVDTDNTYLEAALLAPLVVFCSQPQLLAVGRETLEIVCAVSVTLVRHDEPAKIASDTFARMV